MNIDLDLDCTAIILLIYFYFSSPRQTYHSYTYHMKQEHQQFSIPASYYVNEKEQLNFSLSFSKNPNGQYQFESYKAILKNDDKPKESRLQNFSIEPGNNITATQPIIC